MKLRKNRKATIVISVILSLVILLSVTFAWITARDSRINHFENPGYIADGSVIVSENFVEPGDWTPGMVVDKEVYVTNTGAGTVLVRVAFEEMLKVLGNSGAVTTSVNPHPQSGLIPANVDIEGYSDENGWYELTTITAESEITFTGIQIFKAKENDALVACGQYDDDGTTKYQSVTIGSKAILIDVEDDGVIDEIHLTKAPLYNYFSEGMAEFYSWNQKNNVGAWSHTPDKALPPASNICASQLSEHIEFTYEDLADALDPPNGGKWYYHDDGYFYYLGRVGSGKTTPMLLKSVKMLGSAGKEFTKVDYDLAINVEAIQATMEALSDTSADGNVAGWQLQDPQLLLLLESYCTDYTSGP